MDLSHLAVSDKNPEQTKRAKNFVCMLQQQTADSSFKKTDITGASHLKFGPSYFVRALDIFLLS